MLILAVDDDVEDLSLLSEAMVLVEPKAKFLLANDALEATKLIEELIVLPDVIFLDINMPKVTGKQLLKQIKTDWRTKDIRVVMYSTTSDEDEIRDCYRLGAEKFLVKPSTYHDLLRELRSLFKNIAR